MGLFAYDSCLFSLYEKRIIFGYKFMQMRHEGADDIYTMQWKDVVISLHGLVINSLNIRWIIGDITCLFLWLLISLL